jgi:hypothetical protein
LVFVNYCSKAHRPHECFHFGIPKNSQDSQIGNTDSQTSQDSQFPTGKSVLIPVIPNSQNSQNSQNSRTNSQIGNPNSHFSRTNSQIPKFSRRIPKKVSLGDEDKPKDSGSDWWGILAILGAGGLLAFLLYRGWSQRSSNNDSGSSNNSSPPPSTSGSSNPYDFGAGDFGVKSLDELARYDV